MAVPRFAADDGTAARREAYDQSQAYAALDAADGDRCAGAEATNHETGAGTHPYIPMGRGFLYLVAIMDWYSRTVLAWQLSNTMDASFCVTALEQALAHFGKPDIFNTDQGSQFTSSEFTGLLAAAGVRISMDGRGRWMDNIFIERLWRSLKYEEVYLKGYADAAEARSAITNWIRFYNFRRPHQGLRDQTPMTVWRNGMTGSLPGLAVDMTLRLDDASASPTCPQLQQNQAA